MQTPFDARMSARGPAPSDRVRPALSGGGEVARCRHAPTQV